MIAGLCLKYLNDMFIRVEYQGCSKEQEVNLTDPNLDTRMYLAAYAAYYLCYIDSTEDVEIGLFKSGLPSYNYNLKKVSSRFKKLFPFPESMEGGFHSQV